MILEFCHLGDTLRFELMALQRAAVVSVIFDKLVSMLNI